MGEDKLLIVLKPTWYQQRKHGVSDGPDIKRTPKFPIDTLRDRASNVRTVAETRKDFCTLQFLGECTISSEGGGAVWVL